MTTSQPWVRTLVICLIFSSSVLLSACGNEQVSQNPGEGVSVTAAVASWTSAQPVIAVFEALLEELDYTIEGPTELASNPITYQAIDQGDVDFWANGWFPLHEPQLPENFRDNATLYEPLCSACGVQGYLVNNTAIEEFNITSLQDFTRDDVKAAFDSNDDGRADLFGCPPGWGCHDVINYHLQAYNLEEHINHATASYSANFSNALARIESDLHALYYTWAPNDTILTLRPGEAVTWINVVDEAENLSLAPSQEELDISALTSTGIEGAVSDPIHLGFVAADIRVVANASFAENHPAAAQLFQEVRLPLDWISEATRQINEGADSEEEIRELAIQFIEENSDITDEWLQNARDAEQAN